jgi:hypothetical protein
MFENSLPRRVFRPKRDEVTGGGENCLMSNLIILCTPHQNFSGDQIQKNNIRGEHVARMG